jgi:ribosomal protein S4E
MWIQVRTIDGKKTVRMDSLSKLTKVEVLREKLVEHFDAQPADQRLFFRGKQVGIGNKIKQLNNCNMQVTMTSVFIHYLF